MALLTFQLCREMHISPRELEDIDLQTITDWLTILGQEAELNKAKVQR